MYRMTTQYTCWADEPEQAAHKAALFFATRPLHIAVEESVIIHESRAAIDVEPPVRVPSESRPGVSHLVTPHACSCEDFDHRRRPCKHMRALFTEGGELRESGESDDFATAS
jgi:hypothetical protein